eukprot:6159317-Amphidinium_carterae.1
MGCRSWNDSLGWAATGSYYVHTYGSVKLISVCHTEQSVQDLMHAINNTHNFCQRLDRLPTSVDHSQSSHC